MWVDYYKGKPNGSNTQPFVRINVAVDLTVEELLVVAGDELVMEAVDFHLGHRGIPHPNRRVVRVLGPGGKDVDGEGDSFKDISNPKETLWKILLELYRPTSNT